jgi:hypothetical protein
MDEILKQELFAPLIPYIQSIGPANNYIEIKLPPFINVNTDLAKLYFSDDATLCYERNGNSVVTTIKGTIKDDTVFQYLIAKANERI